MDWMWLLTLFVQFVVTIGFPRRFGNGRLLTRPMMQLIPHFPRHRSGARYLFRMGQLTVFGVAKNVSGLPEPILWSIFIALYLDDYMTGDDDQWKRRWEAVRNKVKWLMELPRLPQPGTA